MIPTTVRDALLHVASFFPDLKQVTFEDGFWVYSLRDGSAPSFENLPINISLLDDALDAAEDDRGPRCVYTMEEIT
jgi:hypothetical protein